MPLLRKDQQTAKAAEGATITQSHGSGNTFNYGISFAEYKADLKEQEQRIRAELSQVNAKERINLNKQLIDLQQKLLDAKTKYQQRTDFFNERFVALEKLQGKFPDELLQTAKQALEQDNEQLAKQLFQQVANSGSETIKFTAEAEYQLGMIADEKIDYSKAYKHFVRAAQLQPENGNFLNRVGRLAEKLAKYHEAIDYFDKALAVDLKVYGPEHPNSARDWNNLGAAWNALGEYQKAIDYYEKALAVRLMVFGPEHPDTATSWNDLGLAWGSLGEYKKSINFHDKTLKVYLKIYGFEHPWTATSWNNLGLAWDSLGEYQKAIDYYDKALAVDLKVYGPEHPKTAIRWNNLGGAWYSLGEYQKAIDYYEKALAVVRQKLGENHPHTQSTLANLAQVRKKIQK